MFADYKAKGVNFYYVYSNIQHSETNGIVAPFTIDEKLMHIAEARRRTGSNIPWLCDTMGNELKASLAAAPNAEFVIDPHGTLVRKRFWSDPTTLRSDLEELIGKVENPTTVDDTAVRFTVESREVASGVVPAIKLPKYLKPVITKPVVKAGAHPFFAKLRAEADGELLTTGKGQLYLVFNVDPLHKVHWNNKAAKPKVTIEAAEGIKFSERELQGPDVNVPADIDPRQFLIDVEMENKQQPIELTFSYTICDDAETFCLPVSQRYTIQIERDEYGGTRPEIFLKELFANVEKMDKNGDGILTKDELPAGKVTLYVGHMDKNENGQIDPKEITEFKAMFGNGKGFIR